MPESRNQLEQALVLLQSALEQEAKTPAMIVLPPDSDSFVVGNRGGLIQLAIASVKAAQGEKQPLAGKPWVFESDLDWGLQGLELDEEAHLYLPKEKTRLREFLDSALGYGILFTLLAIILTGFVTAGHWLWRLIWQ